MDNQLSTLFRKINIKHRQNVQDYLDEFDLYTGQPRFLYIIDRNPGITQKQLVEIIKLSKESVSVTLKRLEASGYIERVVSTIDRREKNLFLSEKGKAIMPELTENFDRIDNALFRALSDKQQSILEDYFTIMLEDLEKESKNEKIL
ncbi:MarR family transcriptional regulator [Erysipelothrix sp. HDW6C]|uniref:MarR family winged helix-turn-helix transcriptional regulator n=1 Tax=Erysipelothrix sp. HDW6C TaxID=2714930 RepID=UPI00140C3531|nr:MarR family transcriptional regulator [Erysipelothrix sp. HDW6C]QIK70485.1 MarR family transcriptional regulator [Erysipelothrix sp. HDW6C]